MKNKLKLGEEELISAQKAFAEATRLSNNYFWPRIAILLVMVGMAWGGCEIL